MVVIVRFALNMVYRRSSPGKSGDYSQTAETGQRSQLIVRRVVHQSVE